MAVSVDQHVRRLHVSVHEPALVRGVESSADLRGHGDGLFVGERAVAEPRFQIRSLDVAHRDVELAVGLTGLVDRDHVRVVDRRGELRLGQEPLAESCVLRERGHQELEGDVALQAKVLGQVDDAHPAPAEDSLDPVVDDERSARKLGDRHGIR